MIVNVENNAVETDRLILRSLTMEDLADFFAFSSYREVDEMAGFAHHKSLDESKEILQKFIEDKNVFALYHKNDKKVIGSLTLHGSWANWDEEYKHLRISEIGSVISKDYWGQGVVPEAIEAVVSYGFDTLGLDAFAACHFVGNNQSKRVIEKCGFTYIKMGVYHSESLNKDFEELRYLRFR